MTDLNALHPLVREYREISLISSIGATLGWDYQVNLPVKAASFRGEQLAYLAGLEHDRLVSDKFRALLEEAEANPSKISPCNLKHIRKAYDRATKLPASLVHEISIAESAGYSAWAQAKSKSDYSIFKPHLKKIIELSREEAKCLADDSGHLYNALLDKYEPNATVAMIDPLFTDLQVRLQDMVSRVVSVPAKKWEFDGLHFSLDKQKEMLGFVLSRIGFDSERGRPADVAPHPFCTRLGSDDIRMTTRYMESNFTDSFYSSLHEMGHGLYEQGLPAGAFGTPEGESVSLGVHESQSRLWENFVGRGEAFWKWLLPIFHGYFPAASSIELSSILAGINEVKPSLIRTESDEVTYNLHVILRYKLEQGLIGGGLSVDDLPEAWNSGMKEMLGVVPDSDATGCLQDVHWSGAGFGYFPTYTLGNLMAAQLFQKANGLFPQLNSEIETGDFSTLLGWLRSEIHVQGKTYGTGELMCRVTGEELSSRYLLEHLEGKVARYYGV